MTLITKDPKYGHTIGIFKCRVPDCQGHTRKYRATLHSVNFEVQTTPQGHVRKRRQTHTLEELKQAINALREKGTPCSIKEIAKQMQMPYANTVYFIKKLGSRVEGLGIEKHKKTK